MIAALVVLAILLVGVGLVAPRVRARQRAARPLELLDIVGTEPIIVERRGAQLDAQYVPHRKPGETEADYHAHLVELVEIHRSFACRGCLQCDGCRERLGWPRLR